MDWTLLHSRLKRLANRGAWAVLEARPGGLPLDVLHQAGSGQDREFIHRCRAPAMIDPTWGYVVTEHGQLVQDSMMPNFPHARPWWVGAPSPIDFMRTRTSSAVEHYPSVISLRHFWEWNYYHFWFDSLGKLSLLDQFGIDLDTPIVLGSFADEIPFVRQVLATGGLRDRNWIFPGNRWVRADEVVFCRTQRPYAHRAEHLNGYFDIPPANRSRDERVFLNRGPGVNRRLTNGGEVSSYLASQGFREIDAAELSIEEQIDVFSRTGRLVTIHGAGNTNILFRAGGSMSVLELHPEGFVQDDHLKIGQGLGFGWDRLAGRPTSGKPIDLADFTIDLDELAGRVEALVA